MLINNAGIGIYDDLSDRAALEEHLAVNLFGPYDMIQAFLPALAASSGSVVNVLSIASLAALPIIPSYSVSKAAAFSLTQNLRPLLAGWGISVHAVLVGPTDTEMSRGFEVPESDPGVRGGRHLRWRPGRRRGDLPPPHARRRRPELEGR